jgi:hypothetical protein
MGLIPCLGLGKKFGSCAHPIFVVCDTTIIATGFTPFTGSRSCYPSQPDLMNLTLIQLRVFFAVAGQGSVRGAKQNGNATGQLDLF